MKSKPPFFQNPLNFSESSFLKIKTGLLNFISKERNFYGYKFFIEILHLRAKFQTAMCRAPDFFN